MPYEELPEEEKAYDRNTSIGTLKLIMKLGFKILSISEAASDKLQVVGESFHNAKKC